MTTNSEKKYEETFMKVTTYILNTNVRVLKIVQNAFVVPLDSAQCFALIILFESYSASGTPLP